MARGKLERWDDERGFGFIRPDHGQPDVFLHISALKEMSRRPVAGDIIHYSAVISNGKPRAVTASIEGIPPIGQPVKSAPRPSKPSPILARAEYDSAIRKRPRNFSTSVLMSLLAVAFGVISYCKTKTPSHDAAVAPSVQEEKFECRGKTRCSQLASCAEARFYLLNCLDIKLDGDSSSCQRQWCE